MFAGNHRKRPVAVRDGRCHARRWLGNLERAHPAWDSKSLRGGATRTEWPPRKRTCLATKNMMRTDCGWALEATPTTHPQLARLNQRPRTHLGRLSASANPLAVCRRDVLCARRVSRAESEALRLRSGGESEPGRWWRSGEGGRLRNGKGSTAHRPAPERHDRSASWETS